MVCVCKPVSAILASLALNRVLMYQFSICDLGMKCLPQEIQARTVRFAFLFSNVVFFLPLVSSNLVTKDYVVHLLTIALNEQN